jgi:hypothetical protein
MRIYNSVFFSDPTPPHMSWPYPMGGIDPEAGAEGLEEYIGPGPVIGAGEALTMVPVPIPYAPGAPAGGTDIGPVVVALMMLYSPVELGLGAGE